MNGIINEKQMEQSIIEMWQAISDIDDKDPNKEFAFQQAAKTEQDLRERFRKQQDLRNDATDIINTLASIVKWYDLKYGRGGILGDAALSQAKALINKHKCRISEEITSTSGKLKQAKGFDTKAFSVDILKYMAENKMSRINLAYKLGFKSPKAIYSIINYGRTPGIDAIYNICAIMNKNAESYMIWL